MPPLVSAQDRADEMKKHLGPRGRVIGVGKPNAIVMMGEAGDILRALSAAKPLTEFVPKKP